MSATQSLQSHLHCHILGVGLHLFIVEGGCNIYTSSTTDDKLSPVLGVEIEQYVAVQFIRRQVVGTIHSCFLVGSDKSLDRSVLQSLVFHNSHNCSHTESVVGTKSSTLSSHPPFLVDICLYGVGLEVMLTVGSLLWHHVHVSLEDDSRLVFHTLGCGFSHHYILGSILECLHSHSLSEVEEELLHFLKMS